MARLYLHLKYGMSVEDYYKQFTLERWVLSQEGQAFNDALATMATAGKITLGAKHQDIESVFPLKSCVYERRHIPPRSISAIIPVQPAEYGYPSVPPSPPMDYYPALLVAEDD